MSKKYDRLFYDRPEVKLLDVFLDLSRQESQ